MWREADTRHTHTTTPHIPHRLNRDVGAMASVIDAWVRTCSAKCMMHGRSDGGRQAGPHAHTHHLATHTPSRNAQLDAHIHQ